MIDIMLRNDSEKQIGLWQNPLTKEITMSVYDKRSRKQRTYRNKKMIAKIFAECLQEEITMKLIEKNCPMCGKVTYMKVTNEQRKEYDKYIVYG